jgi:5S rRNA maturation endonuclease (ribonuclease M5)
VPLQDEGGSTVGLYGRKITDKGRLKHLYLKGPHRGIFNRKASKAYDEVILCESVLDAISLIALGIENVQALYGTNGLTKEHLEVLKSDRVRMVILALDSDEAGKKASSALKEQLSEEGFTVKIIFPLKGKDWNDSLVSGSGREEIKALIEEAEESRPEMAGQPFEVSRVGPKHLFKISGIEYRVLGVKSIFVSSLRVNIQAEYQGMKFLDNVDLYSARSRSSFSCNLAHIFGLEVKRIDYDLLKMVEVLEEQRDRNIEEKSCGHESKELSEEERILGLELLQSPDLFKRITSDLEILGYVGEELNKQLIYLAASSRKMDDPISVLIISQSASGKSLLVDTVRRLIPQEDVVAVSSLSDQALNYLPEGGLLHKFLILGEAVHSEVVEHQIREMLSAHELSRLVTMKDPKTGELSTRTVSSPVLVSAVMSSTRHEINPENASRCFVVGSDESRGQTKKIHRSQKKKYSLGRHYEEKTQIPLIIKQHQAAQRLLQKCLIVNPYAEYLEFPDTLMRTRRDHERFIDLIAGVCFLRQFQKEEKEEKDQTAGQNLRYLECDLIDYEIAYRILIRILPATVSNFPRSAILLYESVRKLAVNKAAREKLRTEEVSFSQREIREQTDHNQMFVKRYLRVLVDYEYLHLSGSRHRGSRRSYRLVADEDIRFLDLSMIPTPEEMAGLFKASKPGE